MDESRSSLAGKAGAEGVQVKMLTNNKDCSVLAFVKRSQITKTAQY